VSSQWVVIEQDEGLMVDHHASPGVEVVFVDYDESKQNREYAEVMLGEVRRSGLPSAHVDRIVGCLRSQWPDLEGAQEGAAT
jgi:hypothetical protein